MGEREVKDKKDKDRPPPPRSFTGRRCREVVMEKSHNSYSSGWRLFNTKSLLVVDPSFFSLFLKGLQPLAVYSSEFLGPPNMIVGVVRSDNE